MITIIVKCKQCGEEMEAEMPPVNSTKDMVLFVEPCTCIEEMRNQNSYDWGYDVGHTDGTKELGEKLVATHKITPGDLSNVVT